MRAISELTSAALLTIIVISIGGIVLASVLSYIDSKEQELRQNIVEEEIRVSESLALLDYFYNGTHTIIYVGSASFPVKIYAVYINSTPQNCVALYNGTSYSLPFTMKPLSVAEIVCPSHGVFKIIYDGGELNGRS